MWLFFLLSAADFLVGVMLSKTCKDYDVVDHLNITQRGPLLSMTMPKKDWSKPLTVSVDSTFISIHSVVEKTQTMTTYFWLSVVWKNDFIYWNPDDFCNISHITLPLSYFWMPDLYFHEQVIEDTSPWIIYVNITSDGMIKAAKPMHLTSTCILNIHYFPFDVQKCSASLTSFMHPEPSLILKMQKNTSQIIEQSKNIFLDTGEWCLLDILVEEGSLNGYSKLTFQVIMKRKSSIYMFSLIVPTLFLLLLDLLSYFIPKSYPEKANFKLTVLLGISVLAIILNDYLPASTNVPPVVVMFFVGTMLLMIMGIVEVIFIMYIGGKVQKTEVTPKRKCPFFEGLFPKCCSRDAQPVDEELIDGDHTRSVLERMLQDVQLIKAHIVSLQNKEKLDAKREDTQERLEVWLYYSHLVVVAAFFVTIVIKWTT
ncbi:5-hydroxytryptamine receptor 3A-like [Aquarana catesbeiana]|uniref:5-hydroxytryptamine receptor 3A-like n=1 Tax=Aquarana catesbeiana TaxID=8400 RepID=UPI003CCA5AFA